MSLIIPVGFGQAAIEVVGPDGTEPFITTHGISLDEAGGDYVAAANYVMQSFGETFATSMLGSLTITRVILAIGQADGTAPTVESNLEPVDCTGGGDYMPMSNCILLNKRTDDLGRTSRGRMFLPGVLKDSDTGPNGKVSSASIAAFSGLGADYLALLAEGDDEGRGFPMFLLHGADAPPPSAVTSLVCAPKIGTLRRRI